MSYQPVTQDQVRAIVKVADAICDVVKDSHEFGAPAGVIYAACSAFGISHVAFNSIIRALKASNRLVERNDLYFPGPAA
jgi:hypothetical protein